MAGTARLALRPAVPELQISDTPSNWDYTFRAGLFGGDYSGNTTGLKNPTANELDGGQTAALWTDARNGRGSGDPTSTPCPAAIQDKSQG